MSPARSSFVLPVEEAACNSAGNRACDDEPPTRHQALDGNGNDPAHEPAPGTTRTRPQRHQHRGEKCRHHQVESVPGRIDNEAANEIPDARSCQSTRHDCTGRAEIYCDVAAAI